IDDFRLFRMQRQSAFSKPRRKSSPQCCGLVFITTVTDRIIGIALEQYVREVPAHPHVERVVEKEIRQEGTDHSPNAKGNFCFDRVIALDRSRCVLDLRHKR
ncbi:MAG TPA: hypothetical protein VJS43_15640, partial [Candidatus Acidoferrales bacterium]|nr:hypothetical protein [Candidatus Acidoferrales bacterium]